MMTSISHAVDAFQDFVNTICKRDSHCCVSIAELHDVYNAWKGASRYMGKEPFGKWIHRGLSHEHSIRIPKDDPTMVYGIALKSADELLKINPEIFKPYCVYVMPVTLTRCGAYAHYEDSKGSFFCERHLCKSCPIDTPRMRGRYISQCHVCHGNDKVWLNILLFQWLHK